MITENTKRIKLVKKIFYFGAGFWAIFSLYCFLMWKDLFGFLAAGMLVIWYLSFQFIDFQYISFELNYGKLILRYYPVVIFARRDYNTIEFPENDLLDFRLEKSVFGQVNDLILITKTSRGIAEYPPISMAALNKTERQKIIQQLRTLLKR
jgi:hypothetical protein